VNRSAEASRSRINPFALFLERLCKDGLVFNDYDINVEKCDLPNNIDCSKRPALRKPLTA
jgi:hypothetical protein